MSTEVTPDAVSPPPPALIVSGANDDETTDSNSNCPASEDQFDAEMFDEMPLEEIRFAPMVYIIQRCILCFDENGHLEDACSLPNALFLSHQWFISCAQFIKCFLTLYRSSLDRCASCSERLRRCTSVSSASGGGRGRLSSSLSTTDDDCDDGADDSDATMSPRKLDPVFVGSDDGCRGTGPSECSPRLFCDSRRFRTRLCRAVCYWVEVYPRYFDSNSNVCRTIAELQRMAAVDPYYAELAEMMDLSKVPSYAWLRNVSVRNPIMRQVSLSFDQWTPEEIATSLTHIEQKLLRRITFSEFKQYACSSNLRTTPILERSISVFNSLSSWVQCMVLSKPTPKERADVMSKFVKVGKKLKQLQNFNTLMSVVGGLTHTALARLTKTTALLSVDIKRELAILTDLLSHCANFAAYRKVLVDCRGFRIPIIGVHLKDLIAIHTALPDTNDQGWLSIKKLTQLSHVFEHLTADLERPHNLPDANVDLINTLKVSLDIQYKEDDIYELSYKREPRSFIPFQQSHKSVVFADWAAGISSVPDQQNVKKHIATMVDAVFKHYDHDKDGYISGAEFNLIAGNFPTIDAFRDIDSDKDGLISKAEMVEYFIKANQLSSAFRREFKHNFHETTFLAPTFCVHCSKLLWGIIRQGFKCKDCGIPVHRNCKDVAVAECRSRKAPSLLAPPSLHKHPAVSCQLAPDDRKISHEGEENDENEQQPSGVACGTTSPQETALHPTGSQRRRLFLHIRTFQSRLRTVSAAGDSPSPEPVIGPTPPPALPSDTARRHPTTMNAKGTTTSSSYLKAGGKKLRTRSETGDVCRHSRCQSPEYASGEAAAVSLASEEVFIEEESATSSNVSREDAVSPSTPRSPSPHHKRQQQQQKCPG